MSAIFFDFLQSTLRVFSGGLSHWFGQDFWLTRFIFLRALGFIYLVAFLGVLLQFKGLFGKHGLLPAHLFLERVAMNSGGGLKAFWSLPTVFWLHISDQMMAILAFLGVALSASVLFGLSNGVTMFVLCSFNYRVSLYSEKRLNSFIIESLEVFLLAKGLN